MIIKKINMMTGGFSLKEEIQNAMRRIPSMDKLLSQTWIAEYESEIGRETVKAIISAILAEYRKKIQDKPDLAFDTDSIIREAKKRIAVKAKPTLRRVVNATGVVLHTNLGRSLLADSAIKAVNDIAAVTGQGHAVARLGVGRTRLGVLAGKPAHAHHRHL